MKSLFDECVVTTPEVRAVEVNYLRREVHRGSHRYTGERTSGVTTQRCGGGRRIIRKKVAA